MTKPTVLITAGALHHADGPHLLVLREAGFQWTYPRQFAQLTADEVVPLLPGIKAVMAGSEPYTPRAFAVANELRVIARTGVGYDAVDLAAATAHGVAVTITPDTNQESVAEHTFSLMLGVAKQVATQHNAIRAGGWLRTPTVTLRDRTLGIVGLGRIGKAVAVRAAAFRMMLLAYEPFPDQAFVAKQGITLVPLERLLTESDFVSLHSPLTPETKHLINRKSLALMKPTAFLVNTARGGLVCEADLVEALGQKRIAGAGLDVFEEEPPAKNPLWGLDNVLMTCHTAGIDRQSLEDMAVSAARAIASLSRGEWPVEKVVNPEVRERFHW